RRGRGILPRDENMANAYRTRMRESVVEFSTVLQQLIVNTCIEAAKHLQATLHCVATESTHVHINVSWEHARPHHSLNSSIRTAISRTLNREFGKRKSFAASSSHKRIRGYEHFDYLLLVYLPGHSGIVWRRDADVCAAERRDATR